MLLTEEQKELLQVLVPWICVLIMIIQMIRPTKKKPAKTKSATETELERIYRAKLVVSKHPYERLDIMPPRHVEYYRKIKEYADKNNLIVCPKVHLRSLLMPERNSVDHKQLEQMILCGYVDFALCTQDMHVIKIIMIKRNESELDIAQEELVRTMFQDAGHEILFVNEITDEILRCT